MTLIDRLMGREPAKKAVYGGILASTYASDIPLSVLGGDEQQRMAGYLRAYKVGWFYKGGKKIADDVAGLKRILAYEDTEGDNAEEIVAPPLMVEWERLDPLEQFLRLMERPNPYETGRTLFKKTQIRSDFAGLAFWYLENGEGGQLPTGLYGISPTRMWASLNKQGRLIGWVMDKDDRGGGVPFSVDEILPFVNPGVDDDMWYGQGIVEAVYANVPLSSALAKHTGTVLTLGGRLAGMMWPRERTLSEDEYVDAQRAWRNVASDPDAGKRMLIFPEPMEYAAGAATPAEIGIPELATLTRDEILTAFPISPYQLGVPMPGGLNSAETRKEDRKDYWLGTIHPRVELLEETIQWGLVSRYENEIGRSLDFDIEEPNLDDAPALVEKVGALKGLISVGFDAQAAVSAVGLDHIEWNGLPDLLDPAKQAQMAQEAAAQAPDPSGGTRVVAGDTSRRDPTAIQQTVVGKSAKLTRDDVTEREFPGLNLAVREFLSQQHTRLVDNITRTWPGAKSRKAWDDWWNAEAEDKAFLDKLSGIYARLGREALQVVAENTSRAIAGKAVDRVLDDMLVRSGVRITEMNETTRKAVAETLAEGTRRDYTLNQLIGGFSAENYGGVQGALMDNGVPVWDNYRAEVIARTETMNAYNQSALLGYKDLGWNRMEAVDGDKDDECAQRNGSVMSTDEALSIVDHPNGTLDWIPLSPGKAADLERLEFLAAVKAVAERPSVFNVYPSEVTVTPTEPAAVNVTVPPPSVTIHEAQPAIVNVNVPRQDVPNITVNPPVVNVAAPHVTNATKAPDVNVTVTPELRITSMPDRRTERVVERDKAGRIIRTTDAETDA